MKEFIQKYWVNALGLSLLFVALLYFLKLAMVSGWFPIELRLAFGVLLGTIGLFAGMRLVKQERPVTGQALAGLGASILYATIGYISFSEEIFWSTSSLLITMIGVGVVISAVAIRENQRILFTLSILGGLITPFVIRASAELDVALFIYVLVLNLASIYAAITRGWKENMLIGFILTAGLFGSYYFLFDPVGWQRPFTYATIMFVVFLFGFIIAPFRENKRYDGFELIFSVFNGLNYILWSYWIFEEFSMSHIVPLSIIGVSFLSLSCLIYFRSEKRGIVAFSTYMVLALISLGIAGSDVSTFFHEGGLNYVIISAVWLLLIAAVFVIGSRLKDPQVLSASLAGYVILVVYWFSHAWDVEWLTILGIRYMPFLNAGAMVWIGLIVLGFYFALYFRNESAPDELQAHGDVASPLMGFISHAQIGGLISIQVMNLWEAYDMKWLEMDLTLSACWFLYALVIFLWNSRLPHKLYRWMGGAVLIFSTGKVFLYDLVGESSVQKILFLFFLGTLTLIIARVRSKKKKVSVQLTKETEEVTAETKI